MDSTNNILKDLLTDLCNSVDKKLRSSYDRKKLEELRKKNSIVEFRLKVAITIDSSIIPLQRISKIFIPVSGKLGINPEEFRINFFVGNRSYLPNPFSMSNKKAFKTFLKLTGSH